ncbi:MAG: DUF1330 domain-containing protein [Bacteroidota bacterium]
MKHYTALNDNAFEALKKIPEGPVMMLNLLKYKEEVDGISGRTMYVKYMKAALPFFNASKAEVVFKGPEKLSLIGPQQKYWDDILIVKYPSKNAFLKMITSQDYPADLRSKALQDSRLIMY